jgi:hypothetical protein
MPLQIVLGSLAQIIQSANTTLAGSLRISTWDGVKQPFDSNRFSTVGRITLMSVAGGRVNTPRYLAKPEPATKVVRA